MRAPRSIRQLCLLGATALLSLSVACRLDMLLKSTGTTRPLLSVAPLEVRDSARAGSSEVRTAEVAISNSGGGTFTWSASERSSWMRLEPREGEAPGTLTISLDPENLGPGVYEGDVTVIARDAVDSQFTTIAVTFLVQRPGLNVTPPSIERSTNVNSNQTFTETLQISNSGTGVLNWTATKQRPWVTLSATSGSGNGAIQVTINSAGLAGGVYHDDIVVTAPGATGSPDHVPVTLTVFVPGLAVSPTLVRDTVPPGSTTPQSQTLYVTNSGTGTITWSATKSQPWVTLSKTSGGAPDSIIVTVDPTGLLPGTQTDTVLFTSAEATNGPVKVPVELVIALKACNEIAIDPDVVRPGVLNAADCDAPHRPGSFANWYGLSANAGEGLSIRMTASFDAYLFLVDSAGNLLAQNDECPGETGTACIMDFPIATTGRYFIEATSTNPGAGGPLTISVVRERAPAAPQGLGQFRADGNSSIGVGTPTPEDQVVFKGTVNDPNQGDARLEVELEPLGGPFTGAATHVGDFVAVGGGGTQTSVRATSLTNNMGYRWQVRTCDRTGRCSEWLQFGSNAETDADFSVAVPPGGSPPRQP
jgi:hypothetical protein